MNDKKEVEHGGSSSEMKVEPTLAEEIGRRITGIRGERTQPEFAASMGIHKNTLIRYEKGTRMPDAEFVLKMHLIHSVSPLWLLHGEGVPRRSHRTISDELKRSINWDSDLDQDEYAYIPLYDVRAAAGHGAVVESVQVIDSLCFKREWIHNELHANPNDLYLIYVSGESMEPTLRPGDIILVDRRDTTVRRDGIYVLTMDDTLLVKRLQSLPGGKVRVISDNPAYAPFEMEKGLLDPDHQDDAEGAGVIGRVVWTGRRM